MLSRERLEDRINKYLLYYKPSNKQKIFHNANKDNFEVAFFAGNRVGKTYCGIVDDVFDATGFYPNWYDGHRFSFPPTICIVAPFTKDIYSIFQKPMFEGVNGHPPLIHPTLVKRKRSLGGGSVDIVDVKHVSGGTSTIHFMSNEQERDKFQGKRFHKVHIDEECKFSIYSEILIRLMDCDGMGQGKLNLTMTPLMGMTELVSRFMRTTVEKRTESGLIVKESVNIEPETSVNKRFYMHATWDDSPFITEESKEFYASGMKQHELDARKNGLPCIGSGLVYQIPQSYYVVDQFDIPEHYARFAGMDFGWKDDTAAVFFAHDRDRDIVYLYDEYKENKQLPPYHADILYKKGLNWIPTMCDPSGNQTDKTSGTDILSTYKNLGLNLIQGKNSKELYIYEIIQRLSTDRLKIMRNCTKTLYEMAQYSRGLDGKVLKGNDHLMNAFEYASKLGVLYAKTKQDFSISKNDYIGYF